MPESTTKRVRVSPGLARAKEGKHSRASLRPHEVGDTIPFETIERKTLQVYGQKHRGAIGRMSKGQHCKG